ncbi:MAG TPA: hypothetical protein VFA48_03000 [Gammaproteobacteria bacterium]|nr:hypothetical protein [Gammaproteobacteria bacterium]
MKTLKRATLTVALAIAVGFIVTACNGSSSSASSGVTLAQFQALQTQVQTLQANYTSLSNRFTALKLAVSQGGSSSTANAVYATSSTTSTCAWTLINANITSNELQAATCNGYYVNISEATSAGNGYVQPLSSLISLGFSGASCTGSLYVLTNFNNSGLSESAAVSGVVFFFDTTNLGQPPTGSSAGNAAYYWYVPANSVATQTSLQSVWTNHSCLAWNSGQLPAYQVLQNDESATGVASGPRPGPVLPSSP